MLLYNSPISGNCYKVRLLLAHLGIPYERRDLDVVDRSNRPAELGGLNPDLRVPTLVLDDGRPLAESNAILWYFGDGTRFVPDDALRAGPGAPVEVLRAVQPRAGARRRPLPRSPSRVGPTSTRRADRGADREAATRARRDGASPRGRDFLVGGRIPSPTSRSTRIRTWRTRAASTSSRTRRSARGSSASPPSRVTSRSTPDRGSARERPRPLRAEPDGLAPSRQRAQRRRQPPLRGRARRGARAPDRRHRPGRAPSPAARRRSSPTSTGSGSAGTRARCCQSERGELLRRGGRQLRSAPEPCATPTARSGSAGRRSPRADGTATYQLATVADDLDLGITHIIRGSDHRPNEEVQHADRAGARRRAARGDPPRAPARRRWRAGTSPSRRGAGA